MILDQFRPPTAARLACASCEVAALRSLAQDEVRKAQRALTWKEMSAHRRRANVLAHKAMELENNQRRLGK